MRKNLQAKSQWKVVEDEVQENKWIKSIILYIVVGFLYKFLCLYLFIFYTYF